MPTYNVYMGQGVTITDLRGNTLSTGAGDESHRVQSCSAVILVNTVTWKAGIYHFPSGDIYEGVYAKHSRKVLWDMKREVSPTEAHIVFGKIGVIPTGLDAATETAQERAEKLHSFVLKLVPVKTGRVRRRPADTGYVTVTCNAGAVVLGDQEPYPIVDLQKKAAGDHGAYKTYGHALPSGA